MASRKISAHFAALFAPWPVTGSFSTSASPIPSTRAPDGKVATGCRTCGTSRPVSTPFASVSTASRDRSASHGAFENHDLAGSAGREGRKREVLPDAGEQAKRDRGERLLRP